MICQKCLETKQTMEFREMEDYRDRHDMNNEICSLEDKVNDLGSIIHDFILAYENSTYLEIPKAFIIKAKAAIAKPNPNPDFIEGLDDLPF